MTAAGTEALPAAGVRRPPSWSWRRFFGRGPAREWRAREDFAAHDYGRDLLRSLPPGAALFMDGGDDTFYTLAYMRYAQGLRPDLDLRDRGGLVFPNAYGPDFRNLSKGEKFSRRGEVESGYARRGNLYYTTLSESLVPGMPLSCEGLLRRPSRGGGEQPPPLFDFYAHRWNLPLAERHYRHRALIAFYPFMQRRGTALGVSGGTAEAGAAALRDLQHAFSWRRTRSDQARAGFLLPAPGL